MRLAVVALGCALFGCSSSGSSNTTNGASPADAGDGGSGSVDDAGTERAVEIAPLVLVDFGVFLQVTLDGKGPFLLRYDTGSPTTYVDKAHAEAAGLQAGTHEVKLATVTVASSAKVTLIDWLEANTTYPGLPGPILGLAGNDLFAGMAVGLNYRDKEIWIDHTPTKDPATTATRAPKNVGARVSADFRLVAQGYVAVSCSFNGGAPDQQCLFDTGAVNAFAFEKHWMTFSHPDDLHRVPLISHDNQGNVLEGYFQRASTVRMGELSVRGDVVSVMPKFDLVTSVGQSAGLNLVGMVGMTTTLGHYTVIDYANQRLHFFPYEPSPLPFFTSPFIGFGFVVGSGPNGALVVAAVVPLSDAASKNVQVGDKLVRVDGVPLATATLQYTIASLIAGPPGQHRMFEFDRAGVATSVDLASADMLPPLP
jgi:hypothetical protein